MLVETQPNCTESGRQSKTKESHGKSLILEGTYNETNGTLTNASKTGSVVRGGEKLNCGLTLNETNGTSVAMNGSENSPTAAKNGITLGLLSLSYFVIASAPKVPSFTCIITLTVDVKDSSGELIKGLATNIPNTTCEISAIEVLCKYLIQDSKKLLHSFLKFIFKILLVQRFPNCGPRTPRP